MTWLYFAVSWLLSKWDILTYTPATQDNSISGDKNCEFYYLLGFRSFPTILLGIPIWAGILGYAIFGWYDLGVTFQNLAFCNVFIPILQCIH